MRSILGIGLRTIVSIGQPSFWLLIRRLSRGVSRGFFEADATFTHIKPLGTVARILRKKPIQQGRVSIDTHMVKID